MAGTYEVWLLSQAAGEKTKLLTPDMLTYTKVVNAVGAFEVSLRASDLDGLAMQDDFLDWRVVVSRSVEGKKALDFAGFVRGVTYDYNDRGQSVTLSGPDYNELLTRRVVAYGPDEAEAKKASTAADDLAKEIFSENFGGDATSDRDLSDAGVSIEGDVGAATATSKSCSYDNVLKVLQEIARASRSTESTAMFFEVVPTGEGWNMRFQTNIAQLGRDHRLPNGADGPVIFAVERGNMTDVELELDAFGEETFVYGVGPGGSLPANVSDADRIGRSLLNRREAYVDGSNYETTAKLESFCQARLRKGVPVERFSWRPVQIDGSAYGIDYGFGDRVTALFLGRQYDVHISTVTVTLSGAGESVDVEAKVWP
jgi:hypothetical protein